MLDAGELVQRSNMNWDRREGTQRLYTLRRGKTIRHLRAGQVITQAGNIQGREVI